MKSAQTGVYPLLVVAILAVQACATPAAEEATGIDDTRAFQPIANLTLTADEARSESRVALVIGNANYATAPLKNPVHDARLVAMTLREFDFEVIERTDADRQEMRRAIIEFGRKLRAQGGVGLFYFAGHGIQIDGKNYLIPVRASIEAEEDVAVESVALDEVLARMDGQYSRLNLVVLDACRNNPYARTFRSGTRGTPVTGGVSVAKAPTGTLIAHATAPGEVASDGTGENGPYTLALVRRMKRDNVEVGQLFRRVRSDVIEATRGVQVPWEVSSLQGEFYFRPRADPEPTQVAPVAVADPTAPPSVSLGTADARPPVVAESVVDEEETGLSAWWSLGLGAAAFGAGIPLDVFPEAVRNDTLETADFIPVGLYIAGSALTIYALYKLATQ